jgi:hypothetical protein
LCSRIIESRLNVSVRFAESFYIYFVSLFASAAAAAALLLLLLQVVGSAWVWVLTAVQTRQQIWVMCTAATASFAAPPTTR